MHRIAKHVRPAAVGAIALAFIGATLALGEPPTAAPAPKRVILSNAGNWRFTTVNRKPVARVGGKLVPLGLNSYGGVWVPVEGAKDLSPRIESAAPPAGWTTPDFDDRVRAILMADELGAVRRRPEAPGPPVRPCRRTGRIPRAVGGGTRPAG